MKLKTILIIFNVLIVGAFAVVIILPGAFLGWRYTSVFWADNWALIVLFVVVLVTLNVYFVSNWKLFAALEGEDWHGVIAVLERRVTQQLRLGAGNLRLLVNAYVVTGQPEKIVALEELVRTRRPAMVTRNALLFGVPHILSGDGQRIVAFFRPMAESAPERDRPMVHWSLAFGLILDGESREACELLRDQAGRLEPGIELALSAYLLHVHDGNDTASASVINSARERIRDRYTATAWRSLVERNRTELHLLVLTRLLGDVERWLYDGAAEEGTHGQ